MRQSTNYELNLVEGSDLVNPLTQDVPNYEKIDEVMKLNENASIGKAVELVSATVHALTRTWKDTPVFRFTATVNYTAGETFTVDGLQVTALLPSGEPLASNCYITGSEVLCSLNSDTMLMTVFVAGGEVTLAKDSERLGGNLPSYYGTKSEVDQAQSTATAAGVVAQAAQSAVNKLESKITTYVSEEIEVGAWIDDSPIYRKILTANNLNLTTSTTIDANINTNNANMIKIDAMLGINGDRFYNSNVDSYINSARHAVNLRVVNGGVEIEIVGSVFRCTSYNIALYYTKK